jgi:hypothetical protein
MPSWHFSSSPSAEHGSQNQRFHRRFWHRIHAMTQPVEFFSKLLKRAPAEHGCSWSFCGRSNIIIPVMEDL